MTVDWHWDWCPRCGATGRVLIRTHLMGGTALTDRISGWTEERDCTACDGLGRVKVPNGFSLQPDPIVTFTTGNATTAPTADRQGMKEASP